MGCVCVFLSQFFSTLEVLHLRVTPVGHFASTDSELPPQKKAGEMILEASGPFLKKLAGPDRAWSLAASLHQSLSSPAETGNPFFSHRTSGTYICTYHCTATEVSSHRRGVTQHQVHAPLFHPTSRQRTRCTPQRTFIFLRPGPRPAPHACCVLWLHV